HREPAARARRRARGRDERPAVDWREPAAPDHAAADRIVPAGCAWRTGRAARRAVDARPHGVAAAGRRGADGFVRARRDGRVLLSRAHVSTGILFGLFPALHSTRPDLVSALKGQAGQPSGAKAAKRFRATLATVQIALAMALLISAGLFTKSLFNVS